MEKVNVFLKEEPHLMQLVSRFSWGRHLKMASPSPSVHGLA